MAKITAAAATQKNFFNKYLRLGLPGQALKKILNWAVDFLAWLKGWEFPEKFSWRWKLDMLTGQYEKNVVKALARVLKPGAKIIDIGAHIGYYTSIFSKLAGPNGAVYAFEADINNFKLLEKNTKKFKNVILINQAVSDRSGLINFYQIPNSTGCHSLIPAENSKKTAVTATTLDGFLEEKNIGPIDFIKIDIEGTEPLAFAGMKKLWNRSKNLTIIMEFFPQALKNAGVEPFEFLTDLAGQGFSLFNITASGEAVKINLNRKINPDFYNSGCANVLLKKSS